MDPPVLLEVVGEHELLDDVLYLRDRAVPVTDAVNLRHHHLRPHKQVVQLHRVDDYLRLLLLAWQQGRLVVFRSWHNTMLFFLFLRAAAGTPPPKTKPKPRLRRRSKARGEPPRTCRPGSCRSRNRCRRPQSTRSWGCTGSNSRRRSCFPAPEPLWP